MAYNFREVTLDLQSKFALEYTATANGQLVVTGVDGGAIPANATADATSIATKKAIFLAYKFITYFDYLPSQDLADFIAYAMNTATLLENDDKTTFNGFLTHLNVYGYAAAQTAYELGQGGGGKTMDALLGRAMDNYEVYYNLYVQAAYEDRTVTNAEFQRELRKIEQKIIIDNMSMKRAKKSRVVSPLFSIGRATGMSAQNLAAERMLYNSLTDQRLAGLANTGRYQKSGGSRRRKTQKKRKQRRKTRKHRGKK